MINLSFAERTKLKIELESKNVNVTDLNDDQLVELHTAFFKEKPTEPTEPTEPQARQAYTPHELIELLSTIDKRKQEDRELLTSIESVLAQLQSIVTTLKERV